MTFPPLIAVSRASSPLRRLYRIDGTDGVWVGLAVFWLLSLTTGDDRIAAVGVLLVLFLSSSNLVAEYLLRVGDSNNYLPFLRRYVPAFPFPFLFGYCALVYRMATAAGKRTAVLNALGAGCLFAVLVFSYVFHWTFALVWTFCLAGIWLIFGAGRRQVVGRFRSFCLDTVRSRLIILDVRLVTTATCISHDLTRA